MQAIEFITQEKNGSIEIPKKYRGQLTKKFRVIILVEKEKKVASVKKKFTALKIKTKGLKFNREEANER